jgi:hypothetical protein
MNPLIRRNNSQAFQLAKASRACGVPNLRLPLSQNRDRPGMWNQPWTSRYRVYQSFPAIETIQAGAGEEAVFGQIARLANGRPWTATWK